MFKKLKENFMENIDSIAMGFAMMNGGYYRPINL